MKRKTGFLLLCLALGMLCYGQNDTLSGEAKVVISGNKWEQKLNEVPNKIVKISSRDIALNNPQTAADMMNQTGFIYVQKSQLAGGSPMIRGFATNRVLLVVDGVRMNNAIFRSGNLQNIISIDPLALQSAEVILGPGSLIYGSDAIGGVMDFHTLTPTFIDTSAKTGKITFGGHALARFSSANQEQTYHADFQIASKKWSWIGSITQSTFGDLQMGKHGGYAGYQRPEYVQRINNRDSIVQNNDPRRQLFSGYEQQQIMQKIKYRPVEGIELQYGFYYSGTGTAPRYDRLIEYRNNRLRFAEWNYGPMLWRMHTLQANFLKPGIIFDELKVTLAYQNYEESRIDRQRNSLTRRNQTENVKAWSLNMDAYKTIAKGTLFYGLEWVNNQVNSRGENTNIHTGSVMPTLSRYPDGSRWSSLGVYGLYKVNILPQLTLNTGLRLNRGTAEALLDQELFPLPYNKADINNTALTPSTGLVWRPGTSWQIHGNFSTGFRIPNIDDLGKLFESNPGNIVVPNANLQSEYALSYEIGIAKKMPYRYTFELIGFHTRLNRAIVRRPFRYNGQDSIIFDGVYSQVDALQNIGRATVWGLQAHAAYWFNKNLSLYSTANYITGKETDDTRNEQVALRHAPPFYGNSGVKYWGSHWQAELFSQYNSKMAHENLAPSEQSKTFIYAKDKNNKTFSPAWHTFNLRVGYQWGKYGLNAAWENITNRQYRTYSSGIVSAGSNLILSARISF